MTQEPTLARACHGAPRSSLPKLLEYVYCRVVRARVGPVCAEKMRVFREDRTTSLYDNASSFLALAEAAEGVVVRNARRFYMNGILQDRAAERTQDFLAARDRAGVHVSLQELVEEHIAQCRVMDPSRLLPSTRPGPDPTVARVSASGFPTRLCYICREPGH